MMNVGREKVKAAGLESRISFAKEDCTDFPDSTPKVAVRHLMRWIAQCAPLLHALEATGYHPCQKSFTCRQLQLVYLHLGEP